MDKNVRFDKLVLPNYIFTYNGNQYARVTPYACGITDEYRFSDGSQIGQIKASNGNPSNYRFFRIEPIKWIVLNYNYLPGKYGTDGNGTHTRLELLASNVLMSGIPPAKLLWKDSNINTYLNNTFNKEAFPNTLLFESDIYNNLNDSDKDLAISGSNINYLTDGSNPTTQILYLLSYYEVMNSNSPYVSNGVFGTNNVSKSDKRTTFTTDYAKSHFQFVNSSTGKVQWWTRTITGTVIHFVGSTGGIDNHTVTGYTISTRPAMQGDIFPINYR